MRAVICGAGIAGLALAQRLSTIGWEVVVVEKAAGPRTQGYMIDFFGPGYEAMELMGLLPRLEELAHHVTDFAYLDETGRRRAGIDYRRFERAANGQVMSLLRPDLELALREAVTGQVDLRFGTSIDKIDNSPDQVTVTLTDGTVIEADLLIGADGIHSHVRNMVFGPEDRFLRYLGLQTAAYIFEDPEISELVNGRFCLTDTIDKQMGLYGVKDDKVAVFTIHREPDPVLPNDTQAAVRRVYSDLGWVVPRALAKCPGSGAVYYDQVAQIEMTQWSNNRVILLGDACYAVSLLAGQGASLGIAGAYLLAEQLRGHTSVGEALAEYQRIWRPIVTDRQRVGRQGLGWFLPSTPTRLWLRRMATRAMKLPGLDRLLAKALVGKSHASLTSLSQTTAKV